MTKELTAAQYRILAEVQRHGRKVYEGRAYPAIKVLEERGLVQVQVNHVTVNKSARTGKGRHTKTYTVAAIGEQL